MPILTIPLLTTTAAWHMPASTPTDTVVKYHDSNMLGTQLPRPLLHCTHAMTRVRLSLTPNCLLHMPWNAWELMLGMVCTPGMANTASRARAMTQPYYTAFALRLH